MHLTAPRIVQLAGLAGATLVAAPLTAQLQAFHGKEERVVTRVFYYTQTGNQFETPGQLSIDHGAPEWKADYAKPELMESRRGKRWRFGSGPWTRLDTNVTLDFAGITVAPGAYYLVLEYTEDKQMNLVLLDPQQIREKKWDAFQADQTTGGITIPLTWTADHEVADKLEVSLTPDEKKPQNVEFEVRWGPHALTAKVVAKVEKGA